MTILLHGGPIYAPSVPDAGAMLIVGGTIAWIGPAAGADVHRDSADAVVDLDGALVAPAFVDAHVHHTATGLTLLGLDLRGVRSRQDLLAVLADEARRVRGRPIVGHGWDETLWPDTSLPTRQELDRATWGSVVYLSRVDVHSGLVSSALVALVPGLRSARGFQDSGRVTAEAHHLVRRHVTEQMPGGLREAAQRATREHAAAAGVAALHEAGGPEINGAEDLVALIDLARSTPGPELVAYWGQPGGARAALDLGAAGAAGDLFVDGALGSHTAWLRAPYTDLPDSTGNRYLEQEVVTEHLVACTHAGVQAGFHAIGDAAIDVVVEGLRVALEQCGHAAVRACRHRIEHLTMVGPEHAAVLADAGVVASVQPLFDAHWGAPGGAYEARLGTERWTGLHDFAGLVRAGVSLALGSDSPVTAIEPWEWVRAAMWHHNPASRLSGRAAFAAATRGGWRAARRDGAGALEVGAPATYAVWAVEELAVQAPDPRVANWSTDPRSGTPGLPRLESGSPAPTCLATVLDGRTIHLADSPAGEGLPDSGSVGA
ncbi:MAG: amidohydrolase family protein [Candidatus Nanopelagicales bacterium]|jgi:predicted amidohydrolase YtcJ|nr:amidohydrolase family protein [Candidatus Nanopelagicales bacterium]